MGFIAPKSLTLLLCPAFDSYDVMVFLPPNHPLCCFFLLWDYMEFLAWLSFSLKKKQYFYDDGLCWTGCELIYHIFLIIPI